MKVAVIYGTLRKGSTYSITQLFLQRLANADLKVTEFFLPMDMPYYCCGCFSCFLKGETFCPHYKKIHPIANALEEAELVILASPVYVYGITGQIKTLLDHFAYQWMPHRPNPKMFNKVGLVISTAAGAGTGKTNKSMKENLFYWGIPKIFQYGKIVSAMGWEGVNEKKKAQIEKEVLTVSTKILRCVKGVKPTMKTKIMFNVMRMSQKGNKWNPTDKNHWDENGWLGKTRPW